MIDLKQFEVWFVTGSQHLYGPETLEQVAEHSQAIAAALSDSSAHPGEGGLQAGGDHARRDLPALPGGQLGQKLHRPDHLDAHLFAGQDVDRRPDALAKAVRCTCTPSTIARSPGPRSTWIS